MLLRRMQRVQAALMSAELLHRTGTKRVTGRDQHRETILYQPERDLDQDKEKFVPQMKMRRTKCDKLALIFWS